MSHCELFIWGLLGHLVGDYWLQNDWLALNKSKKGFIGHLTCTIHVTLYTAVVTAMLLLPLQVFTMHLWWMVAATVFVPHWIIDRFALAAKFMHLKNGVDPWKIWNDGDVWGRRTNEAHLSTYPLFHEQKAIENTWRIAFTAPVYIVTDNTAHLLCLWGTILWLM